VKSLCFTDITTFQFSFPHHFTNI